MKLSHIFFVKNNSITLSLVRSCVRFELRLTNIRILGWKIIEIFEDGTLTINGIPQKEAMVVADFTLVKKRRKKKKVIPEVITSSAKS